MAYPSRTFNNAPFEPNVGDTTNQWMSWVTGTLQQLQSPLFPPATPSVTTISHPNAVQVVWNEVATATQYAVFESSSASAPPGVPFATVPANIGAASNSILRPNINDTATRFYSVIAITPNSRSALSVPVAGAALSGASAVIPVSAAPINNNGVGGSVGGGGGIKGIGRGRLGS